MNKMMLNKISQDKADNLQIKMNLVRELQAITAPIIISEIKRIIFNKRNNSSMLIKIKIRTRATTATTPTTKAMAMTK